MQGDLKLGSGVPGELWPLSTTLGSCDKVMKTQEHRGDDSNFNTNYSHY